MINRPSELTARHADAWQARVDGEAREQLSLAIAKLQAGVEERQWERRAGRNAAATVPARSHAPLEFEKERPAASSAATQGFQRSPRVALGTSPRDTFAAVPESHSHRTPLESPEAYAANLAVRRSATESTKKATVVRSPAKSSHQHRFVTFESPMTGRVESYRASASGGDGALPMTPLEPRRLEVCPDPASASHPGHEVGPGWASGGVGWPPGASWDDKRLDREARWRRLEEKRAQLRSGHEQSRAHSFAHGDPGHVDGMPPF